MNWIPIARSDALGVGDIRRLSAGERQIVLVRLADGYFALEDECTHGSASLSEGMLDGDELECPIHGGRFEVRTGKACAAPCRVDALAFPCQIRGHEIIVELPPSSQNSRSQPTTIPAQVIARHEIGDRLMVVQFAAADGGALTSFTAGAHIDLHLAPGIVRQYSLCGDVELLDSYTLAIQRESPSSGGSELAFQLLYPGYRISLGVPRNDFSLNEAASGSLLLGAGIGITPLVSMAARLASTGKWFQLHHWVKTRDRGVFAEKLACRHGERYALHVTAQSGRGSSLRQTIDLAPRDADIYVCGPHDFMEQAHRDAVDLGWKPTQIHRERFSARQEMK